VGYEGDIKGVNRACTDVAKYLKYLLASLTITNTNMDWLANKTIRKGRAIKVRVHTKFGLFAMVVCYLNVHVLHPS
jgi:hypothetical protein